MPICPSVQSHVVAGHVGGGAAAPVLALCGVEVWPLPTVVLSGHAAVPGARGRRLPGTEVADLAEGLRAAGALARADALLSGYLAGADTASALEGLARDRPTGAVYLCDPVLGDADGPYLPEPLVAAYRDRLLPLADYACPNVHELGWLTGRPVASPADCAAAARTLGLRAVFVTSVEAEGGIGVLACDAEGAQLALGPKVPGAFRGAGDVTAALLLARLLAGAAPAQAAAAATGAAAALAAEAHRARRDDLPVIAAAGIWRTAPPAALRPVG
ncbi:pyridoxal kinase [Rhodobacteraceae bacterium 2CG4]|uniref:pyridoxal kinase n=1 Tax=Halovulum marinum TaxID=2662447 RepID=A0A6L5Z296_9RHOB|nr:PfkB family carbohydrate kinase [Halovulum marinum]MSU90162.1 pyridoxal kinase [Halovulum marinum]